MTKQNKEQEEQKKASQQKRDNEKAAKSYCRNCKMETFPLQLCVCGGGGGSSGGGGDEKSEHKDDLSASASKAGSASQAASGDQRDSEHSYRPEFPRLTPRESMLAIIAELLEKKLLKIDDNQTLCTLTIECKPQLLSEEQKKAVNAFVNEVMLELEKFKEKHGLVNNKDCIVKVEKDKQGNVLSASINIPKSELYNKFIEQLKSVKLMPEVKMTAEERKTEDRENTAKSRFNPSPLSTRPEPKGHKKNHNPLKE